MNVRIIVGSSADFNEEIRDILTIVPMTVILGDTAYRGGIELSYMEFYEKLVESDVLPTTSQASPAEFAKVFEEVTKAGECAVVLCIASNLSGTYQSAKIGAEGAQALVDEGVAMGNELAIETQQKGGNAGIVRRAEILQENKRIRAEMYQAGQKGQNEVKRSVEEYLRRVGENGNVEALSTAISNVVTGQASQADISLVAQNKNAQTAVELLTDTNLEADEGGIEANLEKVANERKSSETVSDKQKQLEVVLNSNPATDNYHTWIRKVEDIKTFEEALQGCGYTNGDNITPDFTSEMIKKALETGKITVYSSKPIENGSFVTPSKMEAQSYAGSGNIYSAEVNLTDVAWVDELQGQYADIGSLTEVRTEGLSEIISDNILEEDVSDFNFNIRPVKMKVFPPYNQSQSDANERATRWAHKENVKTGAQKLVSYHNRWYIIEKFDSAELGYQIVGSVTKKQVDDFINEEKRYGNENEQREAGILEGFVEDTEKADSNGLRGYGIDNDANQHGRETGTVQGVVEDQIQGREVSDNTHRSDEYDGTDRKNNNTGIDWSPDVAENNVTPAEAEQYVDDFENSIWRTGAEIDTKLKNNIHTLIRKFKVPILFDTKVPANGTYENGVIRINPNSEKPIRNILFHEFTHHIERTGQNYIKFMDAVIKSNVFKEWMQEKGFSSFEELSRHYLAEYNKKIDKINEEHRKKGEKEEKYLDNFGAKLEVVADFAGDRLFNKNMPKAINAFVSEMREWGQRIRDWLRKHKILKENTTNGALREIRQLEEMFSRALEKASKQKNNTTSGAQYDLMQFEDGKKFVDVVIDQSLFDGKTLEEQALLARSIIKERFAGKVIGNINKVFVNGNSAEEYSWLRRTRDNAVAEAKMRASTELDNLIDAGTNFRSEPDGQYGHIHKDAVDGFKYFDVIFKVANEYYYGLINIKANSRGWLLKDITQIKNITNDVTASYGENPASSVVSDVQAEQSVRSDTSTANKRLSQLPKTVNTNLSGGQHSLTVPTPTKADADTTPQLEKRQGRSRWGDSLSSFADSVEKSSWIDEELKERILSDEGIVSYNRIANADTLSEALDKLENGGASETSRLTNLAYNKKAQVNETDVAELFILLEQYQAKGDYESAHRVVQVSKLGNN